MPIALGSQRLALLSDIHGNVLALEACLAHAQSQGVHQYAFLGDLVGYGPTPQAVVQRVMQMADQGAMVLRGNHEEMALTPPIDARLNQHVAADWTHAQLGATELDFLRQLPLSKKWGAAFLVHASAHQPERWIYVVDARVAQQSLDCAMQERDVRYVFGGHVHHQTLYYRGAGHRLMSFKPSVDVPIPVLSHRYWLATVGSVGQPRDGQVRAMYAIFDAGAQTLTFHRVAYDHLAVARAIRAAGLSDSFAQRLEAGV